MKMYLKPILLGGITPEDPDDPLHPPVGSQIGPTGTRAVSLAPSVSEENVFSSEAVTPIELPVSEAIGDVSAPAEEIAPVIEIAPVDLG